MDFKKRLVLLTCILMAVSIFTVAFADDIGRFNDERIRRESKSNQAYNNILKQLEAMEQNGEIYFEHYAGAYINEDGKLVVLITAPEEMAQERTFSEAEGNLLSSAIAMDSQSFEAAADQFKVAAKELFDMSKAKAIDDIIFQKAAYSYQYLEDLMDQLSNDLSENFSNPDSIWSQVHIISLLDDKNCISIHILNIDDEKIEMFKSQVMDSDVIIFENLEGPNVSEALYSGESMETNWDYGSIGYRARRNLGNGTYEIGYVTAGHTIYWNEVAYQGRNAIGICTVSRNKTDNIDAAFVKTYAGYGMATRTNHGIRIYSGYTTSAVGSTIYKEGASTGRTSGIVQSTSATGIIDGITLTNLVSSNYNSSGGDSGGIVYNDDGYALGIHIAGPVNGGSGLRFVCKASEIDRRLAVYPD